MKILLLLLSVTFFLARAAYAQDTEELESTETGDAPVTEANGLDDKSSAEELPAVEPGSPKSMSGMSILGNEETPKSLVIVPWKSSEMGDELSLSDTLDEQARPVDKEVFLRELNFYQIRSSKE